MSPFNPPPPDPLHSIVRQAEDAQKQWAQDQQIRRRREAEQRQREMEAELRRRIQQTQQMC